MGKNVLTAEVMARMTEEIFSIPSKVYPASVGLLSVKKYRQDILTGFLISAGGLGESLVSRPRRGLCLQ